MMALGTLSASIADRMYRKGFTLARARSFAIIGGTVALILTAILLLTRNTDKSLLTWVLLFWLFLPPLWFLIEYQIWKVEQAVEPSVSMEDLKYGQELASKLWAAVVAFIIVLVTES